MRATLAAALALLLLVTVPAPATASPACTGNWDNDWINGRQCTTTQPMPANRQCGHTPLSFATYGGDSGDFLCYKGTCLDQPPNQQCQRWGWSTCTVYYTRISPHCVV